MGVERLTERVLERIRDAVRLLGEGRPIEVNEVFWSNPEDCDKYFKFRRDGAEARSFDEIPPRELANAAAYILSRNVAMPTDALVKMVAIEFGLKRVGDRVSSQVRGALELLTLEGRIRLEDSSQRTVWCAD